MTRITKSDGLQIRITPQQRRAVETAAKRSGMTLSDWIRAVLTRAANEGAFAPRTKKQRSKRKEV